jgi:hypothetical protein
MMQSSETETKIAGILLILSTLVPIAALVLLLSSGADFSKMLGGSQQGMEEIANHVSAYRGANLSGAVGILLGLFGLGVLTSRLQNEGDLGLAQLALVAFVVCALLFLLEVTFHIGVTVSAAQEAVEASAIPGYYQPLRAWVSAFKRIYVGTGMVAMVGYGGAILRTRWLPKWLGWLALGWGAFWLLTLVSGAGFPPGVVYLMPTIIGVVLLTQK